MDKWISVNEKLPEKDGYYLIFDDLFQYKIGKFYHDYGLFYIYDDGWTQYNFVTHWMHLPEHPHGERKGERDEQ